MSRQHACSSSPIARRDDSEGDQKTPRRSASTQSQVCHREVTVLNWAEEAHPQRRQGITAVSRFSTRGGLTKRITETGCRS